MENWAIVIGIDHYPASESWTLHGAVRDALGMREWLLSQKGGNVPVGNLLLLLAPIPRTPRPNVDFIPAVHDNILNGLNKLLEKSERKGGRFFFYFAGHGLSVSEGLSIKQGILASDFDRNRSDNSLTVTSIFELFQCTRFEKQFFFIDACRNIPIDRIRLSDFPYVPEPVIPAQPQFVMFATQPRVEAMEVGFPGNESGAFTSALLNGMNGEGIAKAWDHDAGEYVVRWNQLFSAVVENVRGRKIQVNPNGSGPLIQEPQQYGERNDENPDLGRFADASVSDVELSIDLAPNPQVLSVARVSVVELGGLAKEVRPPIDALPIVVAPLRPKRYGVNGVAAGYRPARKTVELYQSTSVKLEFQEEPPGIPPSTPPPGSPAPRGPKPLIAEANFEISKGSSDAEPLLRALSRAPDLPDNGVALFDKRRKGGFRVIAQEDLALLQVTSEAGAVIATGRGRIEREGLPLGFYTFQMISPEGDVISEVIESPMPGGIREIWLSDSRAKSPAMEFLIGYAGFRTDPSGSISPSETIGPTFFLKTSTVLALAAAAQLEVDKTYGDALRKLPLPGFHELTGPNTPSGLHLVFGDERNEGFWQSATASLAEGSERPMNEGGRDSTLLKSLAIGADVGHRIVRIKWRDQEAIISCYVLPGRVTLLVITRELNGSIEIHQYMPLAGSPNLISPEYPTGKTRDPFYHGSEFAAIRRIEYMQRTFAKGRISPLKPDVLLLLYDKWVDPVAGCLGVYLALRMGMTQGLDVATANLVRYFGELPDAHLLRAAYLLEIGKPDEAQAEFQRSIDIGMPIFRDGAILISDKIRLLHFEPDIKVYFAESSSHLTGGQPWSLVLTEADSVDHFSKEKDDLLILPNNLLEH